ncbi:MAG: H-NS histone family protein [Methylovulum sp.]|nr:H-NS histone family protein [Methylovulum sp.]
MTEIQNKSAEELQKLIAEAQAQLESMQQKKYKEVIAQIKDLAASIGVTVDIHEGHKKTTTKRVMLPVPVKYCNPNAPSETWTGRGMPPKWMKALLAEGHNKDEFLINR